MAGDEGEVEGLGVRVRVELSYRDGAVAGEALLWERLSIAEKSARGAPQGLRGAPRLQAQPSLVEVEGGERLVYAGSNDPLLQRIPETLSGRGVRVEAHRLGSPRGWQAS